MLEEVGLHWVDELCACSRSGMGPCFIVFAFLYLRSRFGELEPRRIPICWVSVWENPAQR